jgi:ribosome-associated protein
MGSTMSPTPPRRRGAGGASLDSDEKVAVIRDAMDEMKGIDLSVLPVSEKTQMTDYMVICSGTSNIHIRAIADKIIERLKERGIKGIRREGYNEARWVLMDFGDVVAHVFDAEDRDFYRLEEFWEKQTPVAA